MKEIEGGHGQQCHDTHTLALLHFLTGQPVVALSLFPMSLYVSEFQPSAAALSTSIASLLMTKYRKTPLISTYVFSGLATEQVLIFGAVLIFGGYDKAEAKILQGRSLFNPVLSAHNTLLCMFQRLCTYFQDKGYL